MIATSFSQDKSAAKNSGDDPSDQPAIIEEASTSARFENDGSVTQTVRQRVRVQNEAGIRLYGIITFNFIVGQEFSIDTVEVHKKNGSTVKAGTTNVQEVTPEISRVAPLYSDLHQKQVTVPGLSIGDEILFQYRAKQIALVPNQFWFQYSFTKDAIVLSESVQLDLPKDRKIHINYQPEYKPEITSSVNRTIYKWHTGNEKIVEGRKSELRRERISGTAPPSSIELSTFESWEQVGSWYYGLQHARSLATPAMKAKALELTRGLETDEAKIKALYQFVALSFRYISIDFGIGRYQPHLADEVLENKYGDCKDKHTLLAALLDAAGIRAFPVLISTHRMVDQQVPSPGQFNHLFTAVPLAKGMLFLDTTAEVAPYGMLLSPLRHKKALAITGPSTVQFLETPADLPFTAQEVFDLKGKIDESGTMEAEVDYYIHGDAEIELKNAFRQAPPGKYRELVQGISYYGGFAGEVSQVKIDGLESLDTGIRMLYHYHRPEYLDLHDQNPKKGLPLSFSHFPKWGEDEESVRLYPSKGDLFFKCRIELPAGLSAQAPLDIKLDRTYARYQSSYSAQKNVVTGEKRITILDPEISSDRRRDYEAFQKSVEADEGQNMVVRLPQGFLAKSGGASTKDIEELANRAEIEYRERNFADALTDFRRVAERDSTRKGIWTRVALTEGHLGRFDDAFRDYGKAIAADDFDAQAHAELGGIYLTTGKPLLAVPELNKAVEIDPLSHRAHYLLGWYYAVSKSDFAGAIPELEKALATGEGFGDEAQIRGLLTQGYFKLKQFEKGVESVKQAVEAAPNPSVWNSAAYLLAESGQSLDLAQQYADAALKNIYENLDQIEPASIRSSDMALMAQLANTWDTKGWIQFKAGHPDLAEKYVRAAWTLSQNREVAEHLGEIYEKLNKPAEAMRFYAMSVLPRFVVTPEKKAEPGRARLEKLMGRQRAQLMIEAKTNEPSQLRTIHLGNIAPPGSKGEFRFVFAPGPKLVSIQPSSGASPLTAQLQKLEQKIAAGIVFPENRPQKLIRDGLVVCSAYAKSCDLVFINSEMPAIRSMSFRGSQ